MPRQVTSSPGFKPSASADIFSLLQRIADTSPVDIMAVRQMVEPHAAAQAAANATAADLELIRSAHERASRETDPLAFEVLDTELHAQIFTATRNELLVCLHDIMRVIRNQPSWVEIKRRSASDARRDTYCQEHGAIVDALFAHDAEEAARAMRHHLTAVSRNLFGGN